MAEPRSALAALLAAVLLPWTAQAQSPAPAEPADAAPAETLGDTAYRRPSGPISIEAQSADIRRDGTAIYRGDVSISGTDFALFGDVVELHPLGEQQYRIVVTGRPAHFNHKGSGPEAPPVDAQAQRIEYDATAAKVVLSGAVSLKRARDRLTTEELRYDLTDRRIHASGGSRGQVRITLDPARPDLPEDAP